MKKIVLLLIIILIPIYASAYTGKNYRSFSGLEEMNSISVGEIETENVLFVSPDGNDDNEGTVDSPLKSIKQAINKAKCYYTIYIKEGSYNEQLTIDKSNLTIRNYPGDEVKITGNDLDGTTANIIVSPNLINVKIYGLHIQDRQEKDVEAAYGIIVYGGCKDIIIQNNEFTNINGNNTHYWDLYGYNAGAIVLFGNTSNPIQNVLIANNKIHDMDCGKSEAITTTGYVNKVDIIENDIKDIFNIGIDIAGHYGANEDPSKDYSRYVYVAGNTVDNAVSTIADNSGIYVDGAKGVLIERNYVTNCPYGISVDQENSISDANLQTEDIIVSSNLFEDNLKGGIRIGTNKLSNSTVMNSTIINNTVIQKARALSGALVIAKSHDNDIVNNVIVDQGSWNNLIYTDDNSTSNEIYNTNIDNNYLWSSNHLWFVEGKYFQLAGTQYTEDTFAALPFVNNNIIGEQINLDTNYSIIDGTSLVNAGINQEYKSILRDYDGYLGTDTVGLGYLNINRKTDTEEDINSLKDLFPFHKSYIVTDFVENFLCDCNNTTEEESQNNNVQNDNDTQEIEDEVPEVKGEEEVKNTNPKTMDKIYLYITIAMISLGSISLIRRLED